MKLWDIESDLPFMIKGRFQRDSEGDEVWVVNLKRAWVLSHGYWEERLEDSSLNDAPIYSGEPSSSAMIIDHDFSIYKKNTDIVVSGKARSLEKKPVEQHICRLLVHGHIDKSLKIIGDRQWIEHAGSITVSRPALFIEKEIDYSHAIGGDEHNRIGCGSLSYTNKDLLESKVPSIFYPDQNWKANSKKIKVAGFGPIPPFFSERAKLAGTFDKQWLEERSPIWPMDFNAQFYQSAPLDQQCHGYLKGGEKLTLTGFCHHGDIEFTIPKESYKAIAMFNEEEVIREMSLYTLWIDTENLRIEAVYSAFFPCQGREHLLKCSRIQEYHHDL